ncbi:MAG: hypothetical protein Aurels2KO_29900 [Aureliella sp.]
MTGDTELAQRIQRYVLATLAIALLVGGLVLISTDFLDQSSRTFVGGTLFKVGVVVGMTWLALPQLNRFGWHRIQGTLLVAIGIVVLLLAIRPKIGALAGTALVAGTAIFTAFSWFNNLTKPPRR